MAQVLLQLCSYYRSTIDISSYRSFISSQPVPPCLFLFLWLIKRDADRFSRGRVSAALGWRCAAANEPNRPPTRFKPGTRFHYHLIWRVRCWWEAQCCQGNTLNVILASARIQQVQQEKVVKKRSGRTPWCDLWRCHKKRNKEKMDQCILLVSMYDFSFSRGETLSCNCISRHFSLTVVRRRFLYFLWEKK